LLRARRTEGLSIGGAGQPNPSRTFADWPAGILIRPVFSHCLRRNCFEIKVGLSQTASLFLRAATLPSFDLRPNNNNHPLRVRQYQQEIIHDGASPGSLLPVLQEQGTLGSVTTSKMMKLSR